MATKIEWTDESWNPIVGCSKVSPGCQNCYAEKMAWRLANIGRSAYRKIIMKKGNYNHSTNKSENMKSCWNGKTAFVESALEKPLHWRNPRMIFVCSMGDLFHESVPFAWIDKVFDIIDKCPQHTFQILTKRPEIMAEYIQQYEGYENIWLGVSCENQQTADKRIPVLWEIPAKVRFISCEPLLGPIFLRTGIYQYPKALGKRGTTLDNIDWVIIGCESGPKRRPCKTNWVGDLVSQCQKADVPVFVKQVETDGQIRKMPIDWPQEYP